MRVNRERDLLSGVAVGTVRVTLEAFWSRYEAWSIGRKRESTRGTDAHVWQRWASWYTGDVSRVRRADVEAWTTHLLAALKPKTVCSYLGHLSGFFQRAVEWGYLSSNPCRGVQRPKVPKALPIFLEASEIDRLLTAADGNLDLVRFLALGIFAGLRSGEITACRWEWLDWQRGTLTVGDVHFTPKSGKPRVIPIHSRLRMLLKPYREHGYLIAPKALRRIQRGRVSLRKAFSSAVKRGDVKPISPHNLRHTFAASLVQAGRSLYEVQALLGHSDPRTTQIYAHLAPDRINVEF